MNRRIASTILMTACLGACSFGAGPAKVTKTSYTLEPAVAGTRAPARGPANASPTLRIDSVDAPVWLNSQELYYQLDYGDSDRLSAYSESQWVAPPPRLLEHLLQDGVGRSNEWRAVIGAESGVPADYSLRVDLLAFKQEFRNPHQSDGVLKVEATLTRENPQSVVAQHTFSYRVPAARGDAQGGVDALTKASHRFITDVNRWLQQARPPQGG